jgi:pyruvate dehydrogenase E2 component (dihydrolipoamide acetyltransferase)
VQLREVVRADELLSVVAKVDSVSLIGLVVKAVAVTSRRAPLRPGARSIADVAIQRWTGSGTVAPVVHVADLTTASSLTSTLADIDTRAREGRLASRELEPASVVVVDLGSEGVAEGTVDATALHAAVLTIGAVRVQPVVEGGVVVPGRVLAITLSCDAQRIETGTAARWLARLAGLLEQPLQFLT